MASSIEPSASTQPVQAGSSKGDTGQISRALAQDIAPPKTRLELAVTPPNQLPRRSADGKIHIIAISGGKGGGHKSPMDAGLTHLVEYDDVKVTYYRDVAVGDFVFKNRGRRDDALYTASNNLLAAKFANRWREIYSQRATYRTIAHLLQDPSQFDLVIVNHRILGQAVAKHLAITTPMDVESTDHGEIHVGWHPIERFKNPQSQDRFIVPNRTGYLQATKYLPVDKVQQIPYGVREAFEAIKARPREEVRQELGLPMDKRLVVHTCGGGGQASGYSLQVIKALLTDPRADQLYVVAIAGNNETLRGQFDKLQTDLGERGNNLEIHGFCPPEQMAALQYAAGISEPPSFPEIQAGGGSIGENAAMDNVSLVYQKKSGVEGANLEFGKRGDLVFVALTVKEVVATVYNTTSEQIEAKRPNVQALAIAGGARRRADFHRERAIAARERAATRRLAATQSQPSQAGGPSGSLAPA